MSNAGAASEIDDPVIAIGVLAQKTGLSAATVRKYENEGLIISRRTVSGHRLFSHEDVRRVRNIQHMIQDLGLNIEGIRRMQAMLPCWDLHRCSAATCGSCPASKDTARPCWVTRGVKCPPDTGTCRECVVYRFGSLCTEDMKCLWFDQDDPRTAGGAMEKLIQRKRHSKEGKS